MAVLPAAPRPAPGRAVPRARLDLYDALRTLLSPDDYQARTGAAVERAFDANELFLDQWERHTLRVAFCFHGA